MGQSCFGIPSPQVRCPLSGDTCIDGAIPPESFGNGRVGASYRAQRRMRDPQYGRSAERLEGGVISREDDRMKVQRVASDMQGGNLTPSVARLRETPDDTLHHDASVSHGLAPFHEVPVRAHLCHARWQS